jgi:pilus assembly protein CpaF
MNMLGRFTARRTASPDLAPAAEETASAGGEGISWTVFPDAAEQAAPANPLLSDKLLDAKVRLHRRLIEEINLQALEKLPEDQIRAHVQQLNTSWSSAWRSTNRSSTTSFPRFSTR